MHVFKFGLKLYKPYAFLWTICLILGQLITVCGLLFPLITQLIVDYVLNYDPTSVLTSNNPFLFLVNGGFGDPQTWHLFWVLCLSFVIVLLLRHIMHYLRFTVSHWYGVKYENILRFVTFDKMLHQNNSVLSRYSSGDLLTILNSDSIQFKELYTFTIPFIIDKVVLLAISTVFLFGINPYLAIAPFVVSPILIVASIIYMKRAREISDYIRDKSAALSQVVQENINGVRIVRSLAREDFEVEKFDKTNIEFRDAFYSHTKMVSKYGFIFNFIRIATFLASIALGSVLAINNQISIGDFVAFTTYVALIMDSITQLVNLLFQTQQFMVAGKRIYNFVSVGDIIRNCPEPKLVQGKPHIKLNSMTMMLDDNLVLKDITLDIPYGKKIGIMGSTGSGKSMLLKSLTRFYDPYGGNITINDSDIRDIDIENLRKQYAFVFQDVFLFSNTIDANIAYYEHSSPHEKVEEVAKIAKAHDFIVKTELGYDTVVGENGIGLSGGQKQRISIARALLKNAPVLLLDSATSALDHETEMEVMRDIMAYNSDMTILIASHRASSLEMCDEILYLDSGSIIERGTHSELMALKGKYALTYNLQSANQVEKEGKN